MSRLKAQGIWQAGTHAVLPENLLPSFVGGSGTNLQISDQTISNPRRIVVGGGGKAGAGSALSFRNAVPSALQGRIEGLVNVPADCVMSIPGIETVAARPAGVNSPREEGVVGSQRMMDLFAGCTAEDVCVVLLSGGGSALLPLPVDEVPLEDKQTITKMLSEIGATINELNTVRRAISKIKGGGLARNCTAGSLFMLGISDVCLDPLDIIASGPTDVSHSPNRATALEVLQKYFGGDYTGVPQSIVSYLSEVDDPAAAACNTTVHNKIIGNNGTALAGAEAHAISLGYQTQIYPGFMQGDAWSFAKSLAEFTAAVRLKKMPCKTPLCLLVGGETVVHLADTQKEQKGGRNQEGALAFAHFLPQFLGKDAFNGVSLLAGGTDGEDGPTDAAGAFADAELLNAVAANGEDLLTRLQYNQSYLFHDACGSLLRTGPTHTNVMDLWVLLIE